jgi:hypothetical protein
MYINMIEDVYIKEHLNDLENNEIQVIDDYKMKIPKGLPQGFFSLLAVGSSGSGKTNACLNLIEKLKPYYNVYILISPTGCIDIERGKRGEKKYNKLKIKFDEEYQDYHHGLIREIIFRQKQRLINFEDWLKYKKIYEKAIEYLKNNQEEDAIFGFKDVEFIFKYDFCKPNDKTVFKHQIPPTCMLIIDDMGSTPIYSNGSSLGELIGLQMKNRHYKMSVFNLLQAYKLCPRSIRLNSRVMMLFPCKSKKMILEFADTCNGQYTPEEFLKLYDYATMDKPYDFLYIDCNEGFRKNFNKKIDINKIK